MKNSELETMIEKYALQILETQDEAKAGYIVMKIVQETEKTIKEKAVKLYEELF